MESSYKINLLRFPNEIVLEIAAWLGIGDISHLVQSCRRFTHLLNGYMYKRDVRDNNAYSLFWACGGCVWSGNDRCHQTARHAIAAGADVDISWARQGDFSTSSFRLVVAHPPRRTSPMLLAAVKGDTELTQLLVEAGASIDLEPSPGFPPIVMAIVASRKTMVEYLIGRKVNLRVRSAMGFGPVATAALKNELAILALLLSAVEDADEAGYSEWSALYTAVVCREEEAVRILLKSDKLDPNRLHGASSGDTALIMACSNGSLKCVELLCNDKRTNMNLRGRNGRGIPAIEMAIAGSYWDVALCLVRSGRLQQGRWGRCFKSLCCNGSVEAMKVAEELIWRANMTNSLASRYKKVALKYGHVQLQGLVDAKLAEWKCKQ